MPGSEAQKLIENNDESSGAKIIGKVEEGKGLVVPSLDLNF